MTLRFEVTCTCGHKMVIEGRITPQQEEKIKSGPCVACTHPSLFYKIRNG